MRTLRKIEIILHKIIHRIAQWPSKSIHMVYSIAPIKRRTVNDRIELIRSNAHSIPPLSEEETLIHHNLSRHGFCTTNSLSFDFLGSNEFQVAAGEIYELMERNYIETGETINIVNLLSARPNLIRQFETVFRAGLDIKLLKIIECYLQLPVAYGGVDIFFTVADGLETGARTWHKDSEDSPMVKVVVYLNDVGDDDGPLEIVHLHQLSSEFGKMRGFMQKQLVAAQKENKIDFEITSFVGPTGTVVFCDTSRYFHRGKPATRRHRRALFFNYYASRPLTPYFCPNPPFPSKRMELLVADLSTAQRDAALWRDKLTRLEKLVTKRKPYLRIKAEES